MTKIAHKKQKVRNVPNLRFPGFEEEWEVNTLGKLLEFKNGINASKEQYGNGIKFINVLDILGNNFITYEKIIGSVDVSDEIAAKYSVTFGDILFQRSSETREEVGTASVYLDKENIATFGGFVIRGKKIGNYDPIFLNKLLKTDKARNDITSKSGGSTRYNVGQETLSSVKISLPSLSEQQKIASILSLIDQRITTQSKIIRDWELLIQGVCQNLFGDKERKGWKKQYLRDLFIERKDLNTENYEIYSVSVSKGVINQIEYLGRSFAAKSTTHYNVVDYQDIVYTKSPTGEFPYGIIKQSFINQKVAVSPLYGVFIPKNKYLANILHFYFNNPVNTNNYLHSLVQKGAKNTLSISNQRFLNKEIFLPTDVDEIKTVSSLLNGISKKIQLEEDYLYKLIKQKKFLLQNLFV